MQAAKLLLIPAIAVTLAVTGCASRKPASTGTATTTTNAGTNGASTAGLGSDGSLNGQGLGNGSIDPARQALAKRVVHFDYDSSDLSQDDVATLNAHAGYLSRNTAAKVTLTGHTDERGTREYNLALGERRAKSVQAFLVTNGAQNSQIESVSYGKEQPVNEGHDEAAWSENRRVEINYDAGAPN